MTTKIVEPCFVVISEGIADLNFLRKLTNHHLPDIPFAFPFPNDQFHSVAMFHRMLSALRADNIGFSLIRGIIVVADAADDPRDTFGNICNELRKVQWDAIPQALEQVAYSPTGLPPLASITLPSSTAGGGLETLFVREMGTRMPQLMSHVDNFLLHPTTGVGGWNLEKQGKARYASLVACSHQQDPSRAASVALRGEHPTVRIDSVEFAPVVEVIQGICEEMTQGPPA